MILRTFRSLRLEAVSVATRLQIAQRDWLLLGRRWCLLFRNGVIDDDLLYALIGNDLGRLGRRRLRRSRLRRSGRPLNWLLLIRLLHARLVLLLNGLSLLKRLLYGRRCNRGRRRSTVIFPLR